MGATAKQRLFSAKMTKRLKEMKKGARSQDKELEILKSQIFIEVFEARNKELTTGPMVIPKPVNT